MASPTVLTSAPIQHAGEQQGNELRARMTELEPLCLRTRTSTLAMIARSAGSYHWTTDGRRLADFTSGVLVSNLGHIQRHGGGE